jgi:hypothetical protein
MKVSISVGTCVAIALAATTALVAQGTTPITVVGCVEKAETGFIVSKVMSVQVPARYPEGAITRLYRLDGDAATISPHVGHTIAVDGTLAMAPNSEKPPVGTDKAKPEATPATAPVLKVTSIQMRTPSCPQ